MQQAPHQSVTDLGDSGAPDLEVAVEGRVKVDGQQPGLDQGKDGCDRAGVMWERGNQIAEFHNDCLVDSREDCDLILGRDKGMHHQARVLTRAGPVCQALVGVWIAGTEIEGKGNRPLKAVACGRKPAIDGHNHPVSPTTLGGCWVARLLALLEQRWQPPLEKQTAVLASRTVVDPANLGCPNCLAFSKGKLVLYSGSLNVILIGAPQRPLSPRVQKTVIARLGHGRGNLVFRGLRFLHGTETPGAHMPERTLLRMDQFDGSGPGRLTL